MKYYKILNDNYIINIGICEDDQSLNGEIIEEPEYLKIYNLFINQPIENKYYYRLSSDYIWVKFLKTDLSEDELKELFIDDIIKSITIDESNKESEEIKTKPFYNSETHIIEYMDSGYRYGSGIVTDPLQYVQGDSIVEGTYYCLYKYSSSTDKYYAQTTNGTYKALKDCTPNKFGEENSFEFVW